MNYTRKQFGTELLQEIDRGHDVVSLARWAFAKFHAKCGALEGGLREEMMQIIVMEEGPEFEMNPDELRAFALAMKAGA